MYIGYIASIYLCWCLVFPALDQNGWNGWRSFCLCLFISALNQNGWNGWRWFCLCFFISAIDRNGYSLLQPYVRHIYFSLISILRQPTLALRASALVVPLLQLYFGRTSAQQASQGRPWPGMGQPARRSSVAWPTLGPTGFEANLVGASYVLQPYFRPTYSSPTSALLQPYFRLTSALLPP